MGPMPATSPASRPTFVGSCTPTPTRSNSGWRAISAITIFPTKPVPHTTTRLPTSWQPNLQSPWTQGDT